MVKEITDNLGRHYWGINNYTMWHTGLEKQPHTTSGKETVDSCVQQWWKFIRQVNWMETWAEEMSRFAMSKWTYIMTCSLSWIERKWSQQGLSSSDNTLRKISVCCFPNSSKQICRMTSSRRESRQKIEYRAWLQHNECTVRYDNGKWSFQKFLLRNMCYETV